MMGIPEGQLQTWSNQGATASSSAIYERIRIALQNDASLRGRNFEVFLQGSYRNSTNIRGDSDVDVVVKLTDTYMPDYSLLDAYTRSIVEGAPVRRPIRSRIFGVMSRMLSAALFPRMPSPKAARASRFQERPTTSLPMSCRAWNIGSTVRHRACRQTPPQSMESGCGMCSAISPSPAFQGSPTKTAWPSTLERTSGISRPFASSKMRVDGWRTTG